MVENLVVVDSLRDNGGGMERMGKRNLSSSEALCSLVATELGYGGKVVAATPERIVVRTHILGSVDETIFTGSREAMLMLFNVAEAHGIVCASVGKEVIHANAGPIVTLSQGKPLIATSLGPMIVGANLTLIALLHAFNLVERESEVKAALSLFRDQGKGGSIQGFKNVIGGLLLHLEEGVSLASLVC